MLKRVLLTFLFYCLLSSTSFASGERDESFGSKGLSVLITPFAQSYVTDVQELSNGKTLVIGQFDDSKNRINQTGYFITRLNIDGTTDKSFGDDGFLTFDRFLAEGSLSNGYRPLKVFPLADDSFFVVGRGYEDGGHRVYISKHLASGALNGSYGDKGIAYNLPLFFYAEKNQSIMLDDENFLISGILDESSDYSIFRLNKFGEIDQSFGNDGKVSIPLNDLQDREGEDSIPMQLSDFDMIVNGTMIAVVSQAYGNTDFYPIFSDDYKNFGIYIYDLNGNFESKNFFHDRGRSSKFKAGFTGSGRLAIGSVFETQSNDSRLGVFSLYFDESEPRKIHSSNLVTFQQFQLPSLGERESFNHFLDMSLNSDNTYTILASKNDYKYPFVFKADEFGVTLEQEDIEFGHLAFNSLTAKLYSKNNGGYFVSDFANDNSTIVAITPSMNIDRSYSSQGISYFFNAEQMTDIEKLDDGSMILAGFGDDFNDYFSPRTIPYLTKVKSNGTLDLSFNSVDIVDVIAEDEQALITDIEKLNDNEIFIALSMKSRLKRGIRISDLLFAKVNEYGDLDTSFADGGVFTIEHDEFEAGVSLTSEIISLKVQGDGSITASVGLYDSESKRNYGAVVKVKSDGKLDKAFANNGILILKPDDSEWIIKSHIIGSKGDIFIVGAQRDLTGQDALIINITADGQFNNSFGNNGVKLIGDESLYEMINAAIVDTSDNVYIAGYIINKNDAERTKKPFVSSIKSSSELNTKFNNGNPLFLDWNTNGYSVSHSIRALSFTNENKILLSGITDQNPFNPELENSMGVSLLNNDGSLVSSFGHDGLMKLKFGNSRADILLPLTNNSFIVGGKGNGIGAIVKIIDYKTGESNSDKSESSNEQDADRSSKSSGGALAFINLFLILFILIRNKSVIRIK
ncbi:hypothetical protein SOPP22_00450 [Shewanella sp. OPT22]|nr:hypothetical protein SOPP22_00450 [Shewanella sp. OPT22]